MKKLNAEGFRILVCCNLIFVVMSLLSPSRNRLCRAVSVVCSLSILFCFTLLPIAIAAQTASSPATPAASIDIDWAKVHTTTIAAINHLYNLRFKEAEQQCNEAIGIAPADPRGHFFKAMTYFYKYRFSEDKSDYQRFLQLTQNTISVCENIVKTAPNDSKALFYMGGAYGYRGIIRAFAPPEERMKNLMQAVWDGKKGYDYLNDAVKADPSNADAQMGFGLFNCLVAQAPAFIKPAIKLAGFVTDRNLGLKQLENAAANGIYTRAEAKYWLYTFCSDQEETVPRALFHLKSLVAEFPQNYRYRLFTANTLLYTLRKPEEALAEVRGIQGQSGVEKSVQSTAMLMTGHIAAYRAKYDEARSAFQKVAALNADSGQVRYALYWQALTYDVEGNRQQATQFYQRSLPFKPSAEALKNPDSADELALKRVEFAFRGGQYATCMRIADELLKKQSLDNNIRAQTLYVSARAASEQSDFAQAESQFAQALTVQTSGDDMKWFLPATHCRLGIAQVKLSKKTDAKQHLEQTLTYKDYDSEDTIRRMANRELWRLAKQ
jgi:tetratricopeptide (TPR) repeat protein